MNGKNTVIFSSKWIAYTAMLTALVVVTGFIPGLPLGPFYMAYWCDFPIYMAAYLLDPVAAMIVGGIGTTFFDLFGVNGTQYAALPSLIIHGLQGLTAGLLFQTVRYFLTRNEKEGREWLAALLGSILPALIVIGGYFIKHITWDIGAKDLTFENALTIGLFKIVADIVQEVIGVGVALTVCYALRLKEQLKKSRLLPQYSAFRRKSEESSNRQ